MLLAPPSEVVQERQMKHWGVSGTHKVFWKLMTFQKPLVDIESKNRRGLPTNPKVERIIVGLAVLFLAVMSFYMMVEFLYYTFTEFPPNDLPRE